MDPVDEEQARGSRRQEAVARAVGAVIGVAAMMLAWAWIRWPAPAIAFALGLTAYVALRPRAS